MARVAVLVAAVALCACTAQVSTDPPADAGSSACMRSDPTCTMPVPSYASAVRPIVLSACVTCHYPDSHLAQTSLATYADLDMETASMLGQLSACLMPPQGQPALSETDRQLLLDWLACGAPDN